MNLRKHESLFRLMAIDRVRRRGQSRRATMLDEPASFFIDLDVGECGSER